jgi:flagellar basal body P-ring protein FlgI
MEALNVCLRAVAKPGDTIAIFEGLRAAGALHGELIIR